MPLISTLGAASSRGFGEFNQQAKGTFIEDFFNTYLYTGNGAGGQFINNGITLDNTAQWTTTKLSTGTSANITSDSSGNIYTVGSSGTSCTVTKFNSSGTLQWQRSFQDGTSTGAGIAVDSSGNVYVSGNSSTNNSGLLLKYNSSGALQWQRKITSLWGGMTSVAVDGNGDPYFLGYAQPGIVQFGFVVKYNSSGTLQWQRIFYGNDIGVASSIAVDSSNNLYVVGKTADADSQHVFTIKYNSSGVVQWQRKLRGSALAGYGTGIALDSSANVYITGMFREVSFDMFVVKYNSSGTLQWKRMLREANSYGNGICVDSSNDIYAAGTDDYGYTLLAKYNSSGTLQWQRKIYAGGGKLTLDSSGNLYVLGNANDGADYTFVAKLKTSGTTTSGTAFVSMANGVATSSTVTGSDLAGTATEAAGSLTTANGTATDSAGSLTVSTATQLETTNAGGLVWIKGRSGATNHALYDTARGATFDIASNLTAAQTTQTTGLVAFSASGFAIGSLAKLNTSAAAYVAWTLKEQSKFFDVVTYTGTGANRTISHNLGSVPGMIIIKRLDGITNWPVYHRSLSNTQYVLLSTVGSFSTDSSYWNSTTPTDAVFSLGTAPDVNANGGTYVAYLFAHNAGGFGLDGTQNVISCGSYSGTSVSGNNITLGYEPQFLLVKESSASGNNWVLVDVMRGVSQSAQSFLYPNAASAEVATSSWVVPTATGFSLLGTGSLMNASGSTYIYMAIRRGPMAVPTDATKVFMPTVYTGTNVDNRLVNTTIQPDMVWVRQRNDTALGGMVVGDRMRGQPYLLTGTTAAEVTAADAFDAQLVGASEYGTAFSAMNGFWCGNNATSKLNTNTTANNHIAEAFKRAPGFFDVVAYTETASDPQTVNHNLGVPVELCLTRVVSAASFLAALLPNGTYLRVNTDASIATGFNFSSTATNYSVGLLSGAGARVISYLFASCPGVSKVGSYTGTGTTQQINCGFTSGARFVLIKRTDSTGDWFVYDSARGIIAGNDPYILLNSTAAEVTSTDYVDAYSAGFELSSTAPAALNEAPGTTWTSRTSGFGSSAIYCLTYGNGLFVAGGDSGKLFTSTDGITWTSRTSGFGANAIYGVTYGNGLYVAVGGGGTLTTSTDGITWTPGTSGFGSSIIADVTYGNGLFVAVGYSGKLFTSPDGITWTSRTSGFGTTIINDVVYGDGLFVAVGYSGTLTTSPDGITWTSRTSGFGSTLIAGVTYGNGLYVAGGFSGTLTTSTDGITWTSRTSGFGTTNIRDVTYGNGIFVAVGDGGKLTTSTDGITWTSRSAGVSDHISATYGNNLYVVGGGLGALITSSTPNYVYLAIA